ncbi:hypothetical protein LCGC14_1374750 [marine sediment metagenome]|uniref:Uncharacterized protein n=1 Tax=marine sediment metagenome TaxID=412755 RepID=A0A0F9KQD3_9ZZZZ
MSFKANTIQELEALYYGVGADNILKQDAPVLSI